MAGGFHCQGPEHRRVELDGARNHQKVSLVHFSTPLLWRRKIASTLAFKSSALLGRRIAHKLSLITFFKTERNKNPSSMLGST
jgi:hypothetical protein